MVVQHNLSAMNANRYLGINNSKLSKSLEKLSSGYAINRAGDNAAGLAVSEKMRSQIAGMTQAVKNAQDGISMVQTFEGALTETDSILQRMKTLATQMANGSYDDPVDRTAAQQEFLQLNDELDQIADTDFNGVVVLNGGKMADGLEAVDGEFNYKNAKAASSGAEAIDVAKYTAADRTTAESAGSILDNSDYDADAANALWDALGLDASEVTELNITFQKQGNTWKAVVATAGTAAQAATEATTTEGTPAKDSTVKVTSGTLTLTGTAKTDIADDNVYTWNDTAGNWEDKDGAAVSKTQFTAATGMSYAGSPNDGDEVTVTKAVAAVAGTTTPGADAVEGNEKDITSSVDLSALTVTATTNGGFAVSWGDDGNDVNAVFGAYKAAEGDYITLKFTNTDEKSYAPTNIGVAEDSLEATVDANVNSPLSAVPEGTITVALDSSITDDAMTKELASALDALQTADIEYKNGAFTAVPGNAAGDIDIGTDGTISYLDENGDKQTLGTIAVDTSKIDDWADGTDSLTFKLNVDDYKYVEGAEVKANSIETSNVAKSAMEPFAVSKSNAFNNSEAIMTYKSSIILQTGARTKDAVEFTFKYDSKAIGDLTADLNCTAEGLGTSKLNLSSQKDANYAIDKIDQAINKVSLVRGTFGAIQNRLEHKIDNLNVSVENLTSAESQIRDTNMPQEMMNFTKQQILAQASQSMLAQANQLPQGVLSLLQ